MSPACTAGFPYIYPDNELGCAENFVTMLWKMAESKYVANPAVARPAAAMAGPLRGGT